MIKKFAFFLPQFHEIKENDLWWGKGFTEWTHVKKAQPLYDGHKQPVVPLNNNYYNLLDKNTVVWQNELQKKYKIDGLIYYHYYFNGKKLLEKPAENLLRWKDIDQKFFFCWANHTWYKSDDNVEKQVLIEQSYGTKNDWEKHFEYLSKFFLDDRYEKRHNKPLFMLFKSDFYEKHDMMCFFDEKCKEIGFDGICLIEAVRHLSSDMCCKDIENFTEFYFLREPMYLSQFESKPLKVFHLRPLVYDGNELLSKKIVLSSNIIHGVCFEWDNTPRHGKNGCVFNPVSKETFFSYMDLIKNDEYVFINAWNEWAEGMVLEPTEHNGYKYLEWILEWTNNHLYN